MFRGRRRTTGVTIYSRTSIKDDDFDAINKEISILRSLQLNRSWKCADAAALWERKSNGYRIVDLRLDRFMEALCFILNHYFHTEPMCGATGLHDDSVSVRAYLRIVLSKMSAMRSFCALEEGTGNLVGVLVASINMKGHEVRADIRGEALLKITSLRSYALVKARSQDACNVNKNICIDVLCVDRNRQKRGIGTSLVRSCIARAIALGIPACFGVFTSGATERLRFEMLSEVPYKNFIMQGKHGPPIQVDDTGNYSMACMGLSIALPDIPPSSTTSGAEKDENNLAKSK